MPNLLDSQPTRHLFFTGKGGVGKTTLSTAAAIATADAGRRVLLVSTDPASNLDEVLGTLTVGGRIVVMSYQSLEDRITKRAMTSRATTDVPPDLPFVPAGHEPELKLLTRGAEKASDAEIAENPRAASVRLRAAERMREAA